MDTQTHKETFITLEDITKTYIQLLETLTL